MKRSLLSLFTLFFLLLSSNSYSEDTSSAKYFPLKTGNRWFYKTTYSPIPFPPTYHKELIEKDTMINGMTYFKHHKYGNHYFIRFDSSNGNLLQYSQGSGCGSYPDDKIIDSLASSPNDLIICIEHKRCTSTGSRNVFGIMSETKDFHDVGLTVNDKTYAKNFGIVYSCSGDPDCNGFTNLLGCVIDGVVYGDTNLTHVNQISNINPEKFSLYQNYPNPFNPKTIINYELPITDYVVLKVFDVNGKEVSTLVNERQNPGSYEVAFDGSNLPSGIYFYKLEAGSFSKTKRMILLK